MACSAASTDAADSGNGENVEKEVVEAFLAQFQRQMPQDVATDVHTSRFDGSFYKEAVDAMADKEVPDFEVVVVCSKNLSIFL